MKNGEFKMRTAARSLAQALVMVAAMALSACNGGTTAQVCYGCGISQAWYDVYGNYCSNSTPRPGCNFYANGNKVLDTQDPYFASSYNLQYATYFYTDSFGYTQSYTGWAWQSFDGVLYNDNGSALNSNETHGRDVVTNAAAAEKRAVNAAAQTLVARYQLDANVASNIAGALNDWALIGKSRKRTDADVAAFSERLSGLKISEVNAALESAAKGDTSAVDQAIAKAASNWSTSPDTMKQILSDWFVQQTDGSND